jgi:prepilin-type N-terminal cleavage/methylation domain-containing protein
MRVPGIHASLTDSASTRHSGNGFTLLEVLVAIAILGVAVVLVLQLFSAGIRAITVSEEYVTAVERAEAKMREVLDEEKLEERAWSEAMEDGCSADVAISETLKERTGSLPVKVLEIGLTFHWTNGTKTRSISLMTMKVVARKV